MAAVTVTLHGILNRYMSGSKRTVQVDLRAPSTAGALLEELGVPLGLLAALLLNGERATSDVPLAEGDLLEAFPACAGGEARGAGARTAGRTR